MAVGYILTGYLCKKVSVHIWAKKSYLCRVIVVAAWVGVIFFERKTKLISNMRANSYTYISLAPLFALIGISMVFLIAQYTLRIMEWAHLERIKLIIIYVGQHTFTIMCLHPIAFKVVGLVQVNFFGYDKQLLLDWGVVGYDVLWLTLDCIAGIRIPLAADVCLKKMLNMCTHKSYRKA